MSTGLTKTRQSEDKEIPCLLLPMIHNTLLVPNVSIAEMAPMKPLEDKENSPDWFIGFYLWRSIKVPVLSYEVLNGSATVKMNPQGRIAVLNNTGVNENLPFIAIPTLGIPRMSRIAESDIQENTDAEKNRFDLMAVKVGLEEFVIPDIAALENAYLGLSYS